MKIATVSNSVSRAQLGFGGTPDSTKREQEHGQPCGNDGNISHKTTSPEVPLLLKNTPKTR